MNCRIKINPLNGTTVVRTSTGEKSDLYYNAVSQPFINDEVDAKRVFAYAQKNNALFSNKVGDRHKSGEPKMFFKIDDSTFTTSYKEALQKAEGRVVSAGFKMRSGGFTSLFDVDVTKNDKTLIGKINQSIANDLLSESKVHVGNGVYGYVGADGLLSNINVKDVYEDLSLIDGVNPKLEMGALVVDSDIKPLSNTFKQSEYKKYVDGKNVEDKVTEEKVEELANQAEYLFVGENYYKDNKAELESLGKAQEMLKNGKTEYSVWRETGWFKGLDGKWKKEVFPHVKDVLKDDFVNKIKNNEIKNNTLYKFDKIFKSKTKLLEKYEALKDYNIKFINIFNNSNGNFDPVSKTININRANVRSVDAIGSVILHELQHVIQTQEGFADGAASSFFKRDGHKGTDKYDIKLSLLQFKLETYQSKYKNLNVLKGFKHYDPMDPDTLKRLLEDGSVEKEDIEKILELNKDIGDTMMEILNDKKKDPFFLYTSERGEAEARNVQKRAYLTQEQLTDIHPMSTIARTIQSSFTIAYDKNGYFIRGENGKIPIPKTFTLWEDYVNYAKEKGYDVPSKPTDIAGVALPDGSIFLNLNKMTPETVFHELTHVWSHVNKKDWNFGKKLLKEALDNGDIELNKISKEIRSNEKYAKLKESQIQDEILTTFVGRYAEGKLKQTGSIAKLAEWVAHFFENLGKFLGLRFNLTPKTKLIDFSNAIVRDTISDYGKIDLVLKENGFDIEKGGSNILHFNVGENITEDVVKGIKVASDNTQKVARVYTETQGEFLKKNGFKEKFKGSNEYEYQPTKSTNYTDAKGKSLIETSFDKIMEDLMTTGKIEVTCGL